MRVDDKCSLPRDTRRQPLLIRAVSGRCHRSMLVQPVSSSQYVD